MGVCQAGEMDRRIDVVPMIEAKTVKVVSGFWYKEMSLLVERDVDRGHM